MFSTGSKNLSGANGLSKLNGTIVLGGTLTGDTFISGGTNNFNIEDLGSLKLKSVDDSEISVHRAAPIESLIANTSIDLGTFVFNSGSGYIEFTVSNNILGGVKCYMFTVSPTDGSVTPDTTYFPINRTGDGTTNHSPSGWFNNNYEIFVVVPNDLAIYPYINYFFNNGHAYPGTTGWYANPISNYEIDSSDRPLNIAAINEYLALDKISSIINTPERINISTTTANLIGKTNITGNTRVVGKLDVQGSITGETLQIFNDDGGGNYTFLRAEGGNIEGASGLAGGGIYSFNFNPFFNYGVSIGKIYFGHDGVNPVGGGILDLRNDSNQILFNSAGTLDLNSENGINLNTNNNSVTISAFNGEVSLQGDVISLYTGSNDINITSDNNVVRVNGYNIELNGYNGLNITTDNSSSWTFNGELDMNVGQGLKFTNLGDNNKTKVIAIDPITFELSSMSLSAVTSGVSYNFGNGITEVDGDVTLGGVLSEDVLFDGGGVADIDWINLDEFRLGAGLAVINSTVNINGGLTISGTTGFGGAEYFADYSANYVNRSLVDKEYVDTAVSDIRLKENIVKLNSSLALINALNPVEFDFISTKEHKAGFIAQEMEEVIPALVVKPQDENSFYKIKDSQLIPYLVKAIQELSTELAEVKRQLREK
jgi:hypothetical protein